MRVNETLEVSGLSAGASNLFLPISLACAKAQNKAPRRSISHDKALSRRISAHDAELRLPRLG